MWVGDACSGPSCLPTCLSLCVSHPPPTGTEHLRKQMERTGLFWLVVPGVSVCAHLDKNCSQARGEAERRGGNRIVGLSHSVRGSQGTKEEQEEAGTTQALRRRSLSCFLQGGPTPEVSTPPVPPRLGTRGWADPPRGRSPQDPITRQDPRLDTAARGAGLHPGSAQIQAVPHTVWGSFLTSVRDSTDHFTALLCRWSHRTRGGG